MGARAQGAVAQETLARSQEMRRPTGWTEDERELVELLSELVEIPSINPPGLEAPVIDYLAAHRRHSCPTYREIRNARKI